MKCAKVKNPCKFCFQTVSNKNGLQCKGACKKWAHFKCLNYTPGKISDIKAGYIKVTCPCPDCTTSAPREILTNPPFNCAKEACPAAKPPSCEAPDCPSKRNPIPSYPLPQNCPPAAPPCPTPPRQTRCPTPPRRPPCPTPPKQPPCPTPPRQSPCPPPAPNRSPPRSASPPKQSPCPSPPKRVSPPRRASPPRQSSCPGSPQTGSPPKRPSPPRQSSCPPSRSASPPRKVSPSRKVSPRTSPGRRPCPSCPKHCPKAQKVCPKKTISPQQSQSCTFDSVASNYSGKSETGIPRICSSDSALLNAKDKKLLYGAIEQMCDTVGQLSCQLKDLMCKMMEAFEKAKQMNEK